MQFPIISSTLREKTMQELIIPIEVPRNTKIKKILFPIFLIIICIGGILYSSLSDMQYWIAALIVLVAIGGIYFMFRLINVIMKMPTIQNLSVKKEGDEMVISALVNREDPFRLNLNKYKVVWVHKVSYKNAGVILTDSALYFGQSESDETFQALNVSNLNLHPDEYKIAFIHHQILFFIRDNFPYIEAITAGGKQTLEDAWKAWNGFA